MIKRKLRIVRRTPSRNDAAEKLVRIGFAICFTGAGNLVPAYMQSRNGQKDVAVLRQVIRIWVAMFRKHDPGSRLVVLHMSHLEKASAILIPGPQLMEIQKCRSVPSLIN